MLSWYVLGFRLYALGFRHAINHPPTYAIHTDVYWCVLRVYIHNLQCFLLKASDLDRCPRMCMCVRVCVHIISRPLKKKFFIQHHSSDVVCWFVNGNPGTGSGYFTFSFWKHRSWSMFLALILCCIVLCARIFVCVCVSMCVYRFYSTSLPTEMRAVKS